MRVLVTGSRDWADLQVISRALRGLITEYPAETFTIVHGAAAGADCYAAGMAWILGMDLESHPLTPADWTRLGRAAGYVRNSEMVGLGADLCLAFIKGRSGGSSHCADLAEQSGIETRRYTA